MMAVRPVPKLRRSFTAIRVFDNALITDYYSTCLYRVADFRRYFPARSFAGRYLDHSIETDKAFSSTENKRLRIFCDEASLDDALRFTTAEIFLVTEPVEFEFSQHLWRYYSVLVAGPPAVHHFRGLDNVRFFDKAESLFSSSGADLLHAPYFSKRLKKALLIRGSCSVARKGVNLLDVWLRNEIATRSRWPDVWHCDEDYLSRFFTSNIGKLDLFTLVDRELPAEAWRFVEKAVRLGASALLSGSENKAFLRSNNISPVRPDLKFGLDRY